MADQALPRGSVVWVDFSPVIGSEQSGLRPAVLVSSDPYNAFIPGLVIVVPVTTRNRKLPHHVVLAGKSLGLTRQGFAMTEQLKTIDKRRIRGGAGRVDDAVLNEIDRWLGDHLGLHA